MSLPRPQEMVFIDGVRLVPEYVAALLKSHRVPTERMTYEQAIDRMNRANVASIANSTIDRVQAEHMRKYNP